MTAKQEQVQPGTQHQLHVELVTDPVESGKVGSIIIEEFVLKMVVSDDVNDLEALLPGALINAGMVETAFFPVGNATAALTIPPTFSSGGGPMGEDICILTVDDSSGFIVSDFLRARDRGHGLGHAYEILALPSGTVIHVHCGALADLDVADGDTVEEVTPSGVYVGNFEVDADTFFKVTDPRGEARLSVTTKITGNGPTFSSANHLTWAWSLSLDLTGRGFRAG